MFRDYIDLPLHVRILCLGSLINRAGSFALIFLTIYASEELGFGLGFASACLGVFGFGSMCGAILGGQLADQIGRRVVMLTSLIGGALLLLLVGAVENQWAFMLAVGLFGLVTDMYRPAASAMIADLVPISRRPHAFALMYISINLGFAIAPPIGGILAEISFDWLFWGDAITMSLYGLIIYALIPETSPGQSECAGSKKGEAVGHQLADRETAGQRQIPFVDAARQIARDRTFVLLCVASLLMASVFMQSMSTLPIFMRQQGLSHLQFGLLMSVNGIMIFVLQLPLTHWLRRFEPMSIVIVGGLLIATGFGLCAIPGGLWFVALTIVVWTFGEILQAPFKHAIVTDLAPPALRARYLGLFSMSYSLAVMIGAPLGGIVLRSFGPETLWIGAFGTAMSAVALYFVVRPSVALRIEAAATAHRVLRSSEPVSEPIENSSEGSRQRLPAVAST